MSADRIPSRSERWTLHAPEGHPYNGGNPEQWSKIRRSVLNIDKRERADKKDAQNSIPTLPVPSLIANPPENALGPSFSENGQGEHETAQLITETASAAQ